MGSFDEAFIKGVHGGETTRIEHLPSCQQCRGLPLAIRYDLESIARNSLSSKQ